MMTMEMRYTNMIQIDTLRNLVQHAYYVTCDCCFTTSPHDGSIEGLVGHLLGWSFDTLPQKVLCDPCSITARRAKVLVAEGADIKHGTAERRTYRIVCTGCGNSILTNDMLSLVRSMNEWSIQGIYIRPEPFDNLEKHVLCPDCLRKNIL